MKVLLEECFFPLINCFLKHPFTYLIGLLIKFVVLVLMCLTCLYVDVSGGINLRAQAAGYDQGDRSAASRLLSMSAGHISDSDDDRKGNKGESGMAIFNAQQAVITRYFLTASLS